MPLSLQVLEKVLVERVVEDDEEVKEGDEVEIEEEYYEEEEEEVCAFCVIVFMWLVVDLATVVAINGKFYSNSIRVQKNKMSSLSPD